MERNRRGLAAIIVMTISLVEASTALAQAPTPTAPVRKELTGAIDRRSFDGSAEYVITTPGGGKFRTKPIFKSELSPAQAPIPLPLSGPINGPMDSEAFYTVVTPGGMSFRTKPSRVGDPDPLLEPLFDVPEAPPLATPTPEPELGWLPPGFEPLVGGRYKLSCEPDEFVRKLTALYSRSREHNCWALQDQGEGGKQVYLIQCDSAYIPPTVPILPDQIEELEHGMYIFKTWDIDELARLMAILDSSRAGGRICRLTHWWREKRGDVHEPRLLYACRSRLQVPVTPEQIDPDARAPDK